MYKLWYVLGGFLLFAAVSGISFDQFFDSIVTAIILIILSIFSFKHARKKSMEYKAKTKEKPTTENINFSTPLENDTPNNISNITKQVIDTPNTVEPIVPVTQTNSITNTSNQLDFIISDGLPKISKEIENLLWIKNGPKKNFTEHNKVRFSETHSFDWGNIVFTLLGADEPSAIDINDPIIKPTGGIERPPYYPTYSGMSPEQRYKYFEFLSDPFSGKHDIGYVFVFYYGLERHLFEGKFEEAFDMILKLRDIYSNASFQSYSATAAILACIMKQNVKCAIKFIQSIDKDYEYKFNAQLYFLCKASLNIPITADDVLRYCKAFHFTNMRYIKNNNELFSETLHNNFKEAFADTHVHISSLVDEPGKVKSISLPVFANMSLCDESVDIPDLISTSFGVTMLNLLTKTHEDVKKELARQRSKNKKQAAASASTDSNNEKTVEAPVYELGNRFSLDPVSPFFNLSKEEYDFFTILDNKTKNINVSFILQRMSDGTISVLLHDRCIVGKIRLCKKKHWMMVHHNLLNHEIIEGTFDDFVNNIDLWVKYINKYLLSSTDID